MIVLLALNTTSTIKTTSEKYNTTTALHEPNENNAHTTHNNKTERTIETHNRNTKGKEKNKANIPRKQKTEQQRETAEGSIGEWEKD